MHSLLLILLLPSIAHSVFESDLVLLFHTITQREKILYLLVELIDKQIMLSESICPSHVVSLSTSSLTCLYNSTDYFTKSIAVRIVWDGKELHRTIEFAYFLHHFSSKLGPSVIQDFSQKAYSAKYHQEGFCYSLSLSYLWLCDMLSRNNCTGNYCQNIPVALFKIGIGGPITSLTTLLNSSSLRSISPNGTSANFPLNIVLCQMSYDLQSTHISNDSWPMKDPCDPICSLLCS